MIFAQRKKYLQLSDLELIQQYHQKPSRQIIGLIYERYGHLVFGTALKYLKNKQDAEDLVMNLFEKLPGKITNNEIQSFKSWLYMVTKNECLMVLRKKGLNTTELKIDPSANESDQLIIEKEAQLQVLEQIIEELKEEQKDCIKLFYIEGKSYTEITELLHLDIKKVKSAIQNGKRNLKIKLEGRNEFKSLT